MRNEEVELAVHSPCTYAQRHEGVRRIRGKPRSNNLGDGMSCTCQLHVPSTGQKALDILAGAD
jgi:hypothetical protein